MATPQLTEKEREFLGAGVGSGSGDGAGSGSGSGSGYGCCPGYGYFSGSGFGSGFGNGYGYGSGTGSGDDYEPDSGDGSGDGSGYGDDDGSGYGAGDDDGDRITTFAGANVVMIDGVQTILRHIHGNVARADMLMSDLTLSHCYVVKRDGMFAHGHTLDDAMDALRKKLLRKMPVEERVESFLAEVKQGTKYPAQIFFDWHHRLTGSCEAGRKAFAADHGIDLDKGEYTLEEFLELTKDAYGGDVIRAVIKKIGENKD